MPGANQIFLARRRRSLRARRYPGRAAGPISGFALGLLLSLFAALGSLALASAFITIAQELPSIEILPRLLDPPDGLLLQPTRFYDRTGERVMLSLEDPSAGPRTSLPLENESALPSDPHGTPQAAASTTGQAVDLLPSTLISATLAAADPDFWQSGGYSLSGVREGSHPTLAQQLASDLLLWDEPPGLRRSVRERLLAAKITARFGRHRVLAWYLNSANYGRLAYGASQAARIYFGKPARSLSLAESALLAGTALSPALNPLDAPKAARENQARVLEAMRAQGMITADQAEAALKESVYLKTALEAGASSTSPAEVPETSSYFLSLVLQDLSRFYDRARLERGGLRVVTTLSDDLQSQASCLVVLQLARLENYPSAASAGCPGTELLPTHFQVETEPFHGLAADAVVMDPHTGQVLALAGAGPSLADRSGLDQVFTQVSLPARPPGSLLTPFLYLTAFTRGWSPASLVWDIPPAGTTPTDPRISYKGPMRLRLALANDTFGPAAQIYQQVGPENIGRTLGEFGLSGPEALQKDPAGFLLAGSPITLLEAAQAFGVFANQGTLVGIPGPNPSLGMSGAHPLEPVTILRVEGPSGRSRYEGRSVEKRPVTSPQLSYLVTSILSDETARWPSLGHPNSLEVNQPAAAKIGRVAQGTDAWTIGYTAGQVVGVWIGYPDPLNRGNQIRLPDDAPATLWHALVVAASRSLALNGAPSGWTPPAGVNTLEVCDPSGQLPSPDCPARVSEVFLAGSEPKHVDNLYQRFEVNRDTGRLATAFTSPELIEEKVYLAPPLEAVSWARQAGIPLPPETYDVIYGALSTSPQAQISSPGMFAVVQGRVILKGTASGEGFERYRLQVGKGLNPREWLQIGQDESQPVEDGELGVWDTKGLSGLYVLQLLVIHQDQRVDRAAIQVTVDQGKPDAAIAYPMEGQAFRLSEDPTITFQIKASDDLRVEKVEYELDGSGIAIQAQSPFAFPWRASLGRHTLAVKVTDPAGSSSESIVHFEVVK